MSDVTNSPILHPNQSLVADELGVAIAEYNSLAASIKAIEVALGDGAALQSSLWFVISVLRHLQKEKWNTRNDCGLDDARQRSIANDCLAVEGFATSLRTVTKDDRSKYRIVGFASSKNIDRGVLATGTKAYKIARKVLLEAGLVEQVQKKAESVRVSTTSVQEASKPSVKGRAPKTDDVEKAEVVRRAEGPGYSNDESMKLADTAAVVSNKEQVLSMSEEEFADLDAALSKSDAQIVQQNWGDQRDEDRWSRILGVLAGVGFFVFVALLFL